MFIINLNILVLRTSNRKSPVEKPSEKTFFPEEHATSTGQNLD